jgi:hypothetical protein
MTNFDLNLCNMILQKCWILTILPPQHHLQNHHCSIVPLYCLASAVVLILDRARCQEGLDCIPQSVFKVLLAKLLDRVVILFSFEVLAVLV